MSSDPETAWRLVSPAPRSAGLCLAGGRPRVRRMVLAQIRNVDSVAVYRGDQAVAVIMFGRHGWRRTEMAMALAPDAHRYMRRLVRMAQLTLFRMAETQLIVVHIRPGNSAGQRMAMLVGFHPARLNKPGWWVLRKVEHGRAVGRWKQGCEEGGGGKSCPAEYRE